MGKRREHDFYPTPRWATRELLKRVRVEGEVLECCSGDDAIVRELEVDDLSVTTNDIDPARRAFYSLDASDPQAWRGRWRDNFDWIVSNPPFALAAEIVKLAREHAREGVAMLLRLSFLEPCGNRVAFLAQHPPNDLIVLPRISFTGDGRCDNVTTAWLVWYKQPAPQRLIVVPRSEARIVPAPQSQPAMLTA